MDGGLKGSFLSNFSELFKRVGGLSNTTLQAKVILALRHQLSIPIGYNLFFKINAVEHCLAWAGIERVKHTAM